MLHTQLGKLAFLTFLSHQHGCPWGKGTAATDTCALVGLLVTRTPVVLGVSCSWVQLGFCMGDDENDQEVYCHVNPGAG